MMSPRALAFVLCGELLLGCVPLFIPQGPKHVGWLDLGDSVPAFIVTGKTTREEVLNTLGPADRKASDQSWLCFGVKYATGSGAFIPIVPLFFVGVESFEIRRVVVFFDDVGIVERATFEKDTCRSTTLSGGGHAIQCVNQEGKEFSVKSEWGFFCPE